MTLLPPASLASVQARADWIERARPAQLTPPGTDWSTWLILAGRGWGKTRTGAEDVAWYGCRNAGVRIAVIGPTYADARDTCVEGESGLLGVLPSEMIATWNRSLGELILVNGSRYKLFSADEPDRLRGPQHHRAWCDELAAWTKPDTWDQMLFGLRLGAHPQVVVTTTPKPTPLVRRLAKDARTELTKGRTLDNAANLAPSALEQLQARYAGTRLGRQELEAEILEDVAGALWTRTMVDQAREPRIVPQMQRVVVGVDPSGTNGDDGGDSVGIVIVGRGIDGRAYVLGDWTCKLSPAGWGCRVVDAHREFKADRIVAERNFGGAMVESVIRTAGPNVPVKLVTASRGKIVRAEPVAALYEQGRVSHLGSGLEAMEDQMVSMTPDGFIGEGSPDRVDAMVWALTELMLEREAPIAAASAYSMRR